VGFRHGVVRCRGDLPLDNLARLQRYTNHRTLLGTDGEIHSVASEHEQGLPGSESRERLGDWLSFGGKTPLDYIDTVYFACTTRMMAEMAAATGKRKKPLNTAICRRSKAGLQQQIREGGWLLAIDTQTAYSLALFMDLIPEELPLKSGSILAGKIRSNASATNSGITTGFLGTRPLLPVLSAVGQHNLAVQLFQSRKFPSWGYEIEQGATTIWERWNSYTKDNGFGGEQNASMNSFAHYAFGAVGEWMFFQLAGIDSDLPSYKHIIIKPTPPGYRSNPEREPIRWVKAHYDSIRGRIISNWRISGDKFELETGIPPNTSATVYLPTRTAAGITEGGRPLNQGKGIQFLGLRGDRVAMEIEPGTYKFACYFTPESSE
jgi:alpha-L-rhamnosidase